MNICSLTAGCDQYGPKFSPKNHVFAALALLHAVKTLTLKRTPKS